jgi:hypothetical protein
MSKTLLRTISAALATLLAFAACCRSSAVADVISQQSYRLEIATNLTWLDNRDDPIVRVLASQQNFFDRMVANANPYLRITNLSDHTRLVGAQLNLAKSSAKIVDVEWLEKPGEAAWFWDTTTLPEHAHFQFIDPVLPGKSVSMRLSTAARDDGYTMWQNLFQTGETPFGETEDYGVMSLLVEETLSRQQVQFDDKGHPLNVNLLATPLVYDLNTVPRTTYNALGEVNASSEYALQTSLEIQAVPEPSAYVTAGAALATLAMWRSARRRGLGKLRKA